MSYNLEVDSAEIHLQLLVVKREREREMCVKQKKA